jgi:uroporphyrin-III C-methyltransferase/precorrin-2 dehydrogenase/sirohydrochlorin ferrochelatase
VTIAPDPVPGPSRQVQRHCYPLALDLRGRRAVVVGGGPVAARRAHGLVDAGADLVVVAPWLCEALAHLVATGAVRWRAREYVPGDLAGAWLVHTATGDPETDDAVAAAADADRIWCVRADDAARSAAWTPAVARLGDLVVAVTAGSDPRRAVALRDAVAAALDAGDLPTRTVRGRGSGGGHVALVGGGPGDPGLITTRGRRLLAEADVVVVDRLAPRALLGELPDDVEIVDVGKTAGHHPVPQHEINRILVERARAGLRVVRLKGGDPYVLGRGGEELLACRAAGVPVEVVPGVTSAFAVPAAAGIPVTHRGLSKQVTVVSGHEELDDATAGGTGTLVLLMGVSALRETSASLLAAGRAPSTPAAVVEDGFGPRQRVTTGTLADIADLAAGRGVRAPAVVVVGEVAALAEATP